MPNIKKSVSQHKRGGTYRKDRHGDKNSVVIEGGIGTPPEDMTKEAEDEWVRVVEALKGVGVLRETDRSMLLLYCELVAQVQREGVAGVQTSRISLMRHLARDFGLTPMSRAHIPTLDDGGEGGDII